MLFPAPIDDREWPLLQLVAQAADLCRRPLQHAVRFNGEPPSTIGDCTDCCLLIETRKPNGERSPLDDLELEIYRSGHDLNLMLSSTADDGAAVLWHGSHPVWMLPDSGARCPRPDGGAPLEALCRRLRALLVTGPDP